jgi:5'-nucleotidase
MRPGLVLLLSLAAACAASAPQASTAPASPSTRVPVAAAAPPAAPAPSRELTITVLGLNDLHGRLRALPVFAGYVNNVRAVRAKDGGGVLVLDAGDIFQGSLESNLTEGASVFTAYRALGMQAAALGNHEFDFGPVGEGASGDPQGAIKARLAEAGFPVLSANLVDQATGARPEWPGLASSVLLEVAGVRVGVVGALTTGTPHIVMPAYFRGLAVAKIAPVLAAEAKALRERGASVVLATVHAGGDCKKLDDPHDLSSCEADAEIFRVIEQLPRGSVDAVVAGHSHAGVAHYVNGVAVVEAYARGAMFSRVDLVLDSATKELLRALPRPPHPLCPDLTRADCGASGSYEGAPVLADAQVQAAIAPALELAKDKRAELLGPAALDVIKRAHGKESPLGNLFADLVRAAVPGADAAIVNGGSLRAELPAGPLSYGALYEAMPFDNRLARVTLPAEALLRVLTRNLSHDDHGVVSLSGLRVQAKCKGGELKVTLRRESGARVRPAESLRVATSDYLATGGDRLFAPAPLTESQIEPDLGTTVRDAMAAELRKRASVDPKALHDPKKPRLRLPSPRPIDCAPQAAPEPPSTPPAPNAAGTP